MSTEPMSALTIANHTVAISSHLTGLLNEVARVSAAQTAPPPPPPPSSTNNDEVLRTLQSIVSELAGLRRDVDAIKAQLCQDHRTSSSDESQQQTTEITEPNLEELMELKAGVRYVDEPKTAEEYNEIARRYNSGLRDCHELLAPLRNSRNKLVFGFPGTVGDLLYPNPTAERLLCGAFGIEYVNDALVFPTFCGIEHTVLPERSDRKKRVGHIMELRVVWRHERAKDIATVGDPTPETRQAAALHNSITRQRNATVRESIGRLRDERNLEVPGSPTSWTWFSKARRRDVLWMLGEYGLDVAEEGCLERFKEFLSVPREVKAERGEEWLF